MYRQFKTIYCLQQKINAFYTEQVRCYSSKSIAYKELIDIRDENPGGSYYITETLLDDRE